MSDVTVQAGTIELDTNETAPLLRWYSKVNWETSDGVSIGKGRPGSDDFCKEVACTAVDNIVSYPSFTIASTTDAQVLSRTKPYSVSLHRANGELIQVLYKNLKVGTSTPVTLGQIVAASRAASPALPPAYYTSDETDALLSSIQSELTALTTNTSLLSSHTNLATAVASIGSTPTVLIIDTDATVTTNIVVPTTLLFKFSKGAKITITNPGTIEFLGQGVAQEDLDSGALLFVVPQPLVWSGNVSNVRGTATVTQDGNNYDAKSARDVGRFVYMPHLNFRTTVASVGSNTSFVLTDKPSPSDFAITAIQTDQTLGGAPYQGYFTKVGHGLRTGVKVRLTTTSALPTGFATATDYYVIKQTDDTFRLASSLRNAYNHLPIALSDSGTGTHTVDCTLPASNDISLQTLIVYNLKFSGTTHPSSACTRTVDTVDMGNLSVGGSSRTYADAKLSGRINALSCALAEQPSTIKIYPDEALVFYAQFTPKHTYEFAEGTFQNEGASFYSIAVGSNVRVKGAGRGLTTIMQPATYNQYQVFMDGYLSSPDIGDITDRIEHVELSDFTILGQPKPQYYLGGNGQIQSVIGFSKIRDLYIHHIGLDNCVGLGIFAGEGLTSGSEAELYTEDVEIVDNYFYRHPSQAVGVISGNGVTVSRNRIRLLSPSYAFATSVIDIEPIGSVPSPKGIFNIVVEDNIIDVSDSVDGGVINGINIVGGEYQGFKGVSVCRNKIIGREPLSSTALDSVGNALLDSGILLQDINSGIIEGNYILGKLGSYAIYASLCSHLTIRGNTSDGHGYGGLIQLFAVSNSVIESNNGFEERDVIAAGGEPLAIAEHTYNVTVTTDGSTAVVTRNGGDISYFTSAMVGSVLRISGTDYLIKSVDSNNQVTLESVPPMVTAATATARCCLNCFKDNRPGSGGTTLIDSGAYSSVLYSSLTDFRKKGTVTIDPASINANTVSPQTFTLTGAKTGDTVIVNPPAAGLTAGLVVQQAFISAADTLTLVLNNTTENPIDQASGTWDYALFR